MKKKIILSLVTVVSFGFLFSYNIVKSGDSLQAQNIEALAHGVNKNGVCRSPGDSCCNWGDFEMDGNWVNVVVVVDQPCDDC